MAELSEVSEEESKLEVKPMFEEPEIKFPKIEKLSAEISPDVTPSK